MHRLRPFVPSVRFVLFTALAASVGALTACDDGTPAVAPAADNGSDNSPADASGDQAAPDAGTLDIAGPEAATPDTATPDTAMPDTAAPDTATPDTTATDVATPDTATDTATADTVTAPDAPDTASNPDTGPETVACEAPTLADEITRVNAAALIAEPYGCDANNDGNANAMDGELNGALALLPENADINATLATNLEQGGLLLLAEFVGYTGSDAADVTTNLLVGASIDAQPDPSCGVGAGNLDQVCDWDIDPTSYAADGCTPLVSVPGCTVNGGALACGPANFQFSIPLGGANIALDIQNGRILGDLSTGAVLSDGRLCGSVPLDSITSAIEGACADGDIDPSVCDLQILIGIVLSGACVDSDCTVVLGIDGVATGTVVVAN